ncbi:hypothetical protein [Parabacteroides gordonii]|jgi:hypothetical protein|uniref:Uncharacterized protein n=1 Tax=Parabacteroides gordonii MS-1 = DSM 23371 TaxID=1203610 RepID=A0A0F5JNI9_9BACT|nr:hypothetical protein [Parabacteroides gordonii]KKB59381.1 hypothetical protein HMPREF1536_00929 [Parabacteroides gordonii MS-1 = DSM 23371]MCA5583663.1 hypothetical protein [Parabacteroides gordonii]RGP15000.1 hypothetical protein DXB27_16215 [Parabacteroides gordonii]
MKKLVLIGMCCFVTLGLKSQNYNSDKRILTNFIIRMYNNAPFEGVRIVNDYDNAYLISVLSLDKTKYRTEAVLNRIASVKAMAEATRFLNGSTISQEMIIHTKEKADGSSDSEWIETIRENSVGYVQSLEQLTNFTRKDGMQVYIYIKQIDPKKRGNNLR